MTETQRQLVNAACDEIDTTVDAVCDEIDTTVDFCEDRTMNAEHRYSFTDDIESWLYDNSRKIAELLWCPNLESSWKAWIYVDGDEIKAAYHTQNTAPNDDERDDFFITSIWNDIDDEGHQFDDEYNEIDYIADYVFNGGLN